MKNDAYYKGPFGFHIKKVNGGLGVAVKVKGASNQERGDTTEVK